jgi:hypothetical protein
MSAWTCGTAACAIGWAARDPDFNQLGFVLAEDRLPVYVLDDTPGADNPENWDAVCAFFELPTGTADYLFYDTSYPDCKPTPADVIARIREVLARDEADDDARRQVEDIEQAYIAAGEPEPRDE